METELLSPLNASRGQVTLMNNELSPQLNRPGPIPERSRAPPFCAALEFIKRTLLIYWLMNAWPFCLLCFLQFCSVSEEQSSGQLINKHDSGRDA